MTVSHVAVAAFLAQYFGYVLLSTVIERVVFRDSSRRARFKVQPKTAPMGTVATSRDAHWGFPLYQLVTGRRNASNANLHPYHLAFASINLALSSAFAGAVGECVFRGTSTLRQTSTLASFCVGLARAVAMQCVLEYYWHRLMHMRWFYKTLHKYHHHYKSPNVWCDLFIHPLEAFGYYCILYAPAVCVPMPTTAFLAYMVIMGVCGVLDHSGARLDAPFGIYRVKFHDDHHKLYNVNYAFPFDWMDVLHGTRAEDCSAGARNEKFPVESKTN